MSTSTERVGDVARVTVEHTEGVMDAEVELLGMASSQRPEHRHESGRSCSACRWTEVRIYRSTERNEDDRFVYFVRTSGVSEVSGEVRFERVVETSSPYRVMEVLTHRAGEKTSLPRISIEAMSEAAGYDSGLREAWLERAVA